MVSDSVRMYVEVRVFMGVRGRDWVGLNVKVGDAVLDAVGVGRSVLLMVLDSEKVLECEGETDDVKETEREIVGSCVTDDRFSHKHW